MDEDDDSIVIGRSIFVQGDFKRLAARGIEGDAIGGDLDINRPGFDGREIGDAIFWRQFDRLTTGAKKAGSQQGAMYLLAG